MMMRIDMEDSNNIKVYVNDELVASGTWEEVDPMIKSIREKHVKKEALYSKTQEPMDKGQPTMSSIA